MPVSLDFVARIISVAENSVATAEPTLFDVAEEWKSGEQLGEDFFVGCTPNLSSGSWLGPKQGE